MSAENDTKFRGICKYANGKCTQERTLKISGGVHTLCEVHRQRACRNQRKLDSKRRLARIERSNNGPFKTKQLPKSMQKVTHDGSGHEKYHLQQISFTVNKITMLNDMANPMYFLGQSQSLEYKMNSTEKSSDVPVQKRQSPETK